jgi:hypothetical protein
MPKRRSTGGAPEAIRAFQTAFGGPIEGVDEARAGRQTAAALRSQ